MKHLEIKSAHYIFLIKGYAEWLDILGYSERTVNSSPVRIRELLNYLEQKNITHITQVKSRHISGFIQYFKHRTNIKYGGALGASSINNMITDINIFARYLNQTEKHILDVTPNRIQNDVDERTILTREEIKQLYEATFTHHRQNTIAIGQRDRAIIAIFYGCGLRKEEGAKLNIMDIDLNRKLVFVRKAKGNKQRYVPIANKHAADIKAYLEEGRNWFLEDHYQSGFYIRSGRQAPKKQNTNTEAFFLSMKGKRMHSFYSRLQYLKEKSGIEKLFSTHNLRHSIATHLLQSGMPMEEIAKFLGHASLESTQIYTHIVNQLNNKEYAEL